MSGFPQVILGLKYELLVNGTWTDISEFVYQRDDQIVTRGRPTETGQIQPAQMTLTLNNQDGSFSPKNTSGQYYPYIGRNTQFRCSVNTTSSTGTAYSGFRFWGEVSSWPPQWDSTGSDVYVQITVGGILRRYIQGSNIGSALRRFYMLKTDVTAPVSYWPCEEGTNATQFGNLITPGDDLTWTGTPGTSSNSDFEGSDPIPLISNSIWTGVTGLFSSSGPQTFSSPGTYLWTAPGGVTSLSTVECWAAGGGGANGLAGNSGGGGEYAKATSVAVTSAKQYTVTVGRGGSGGALSSSSQIAGAAGGNSSFPGDAVTVTAHAGGGGPTGTGAGAGGTGSSNTTHFNGGAGHAVTLVGASGGAGGGSSAGTAAAGSAGSANSGTNGGAGGAAPTGGGAGGKGGTTPTGPGTGLPGSTPGGGGGGGSESPEGSGHTGGSGAAGKVTLNWSSSTTPNNVVIRGLLSVPAAGATDTATLLRGVVSSGTMAKIEMYYGTTGGGSLGFRGLTSGGATTFDSTYVTFGINGKPCLFSLELAKSGTGFTWKIAVGLPGASTYSLGSGTVASSTIGAVSQIAINPAGNINDTAIGHIVLQYANEDMLASGLLDAINGHDGELVTDRHARLCTEEGFTGTPVFSETKDHWGFESGTQRWTAASNCTIAQTTYSLPDQGFAGDPWPTEGTHSLAITPSTNAAFYARSPSGTSGLPVAPGDVVSASVDASSESNAAFILNPYIAIEWFTSGGTSISVTTGATFVLGAQAPYDNKQRVIGTAPSTAAFFAIRVGGSGTSGTTPTMVIDNVTVGTAMGPQRDESFTDLLQECEDAGQGQIFEARDMLGLYYATRLSMMGQTADVTWNYTAAMLAGSLQPAYDDARTRNDVSVSRLNGSAINQQLLNGALSVQTPPNGVGDYNYTATINVSTDAQLTNLALWILGVGTVDQYRYPSVTVDLTRTEVAGSGVFDATAGLDVGAYFQITNPPTWVPESPVKQLCWGFTETLNAYVWTINVNAVPETPYEATSYGWW